MRFICLYCLFCLIHFTSFGQKKARDFKVITTDKKPIELYKDYLDKGKIVMLKIMFVDCPPCNDIAPQISQLYKKYGSGTQKVEFIELSNKAWDADAAMIGYKIRYDLPCPSVSNDGGSVQAAALYSDNFFGSFFGTPTFVVIKPDGLLDFDPRGGNKNETIALLDSALSRAVRSLLPVIPPPFPGDTTKPIPPVDTIKPIPPGDTVKPVPPAPKLDTLSFAGKLTYNSNTLGLVNFTLDINSKLFKFNTDLQGNFKINIPDTFKNISSAKLTIDYNVNFNEDVSALDLLLIQRHILAIEKLNDFKKMLAADANTDGEINALDLLEFRKIILGISNSLPNNTPSVHFLITNANNLIKSLANPINMDELRALKGKQINIEVVKTGNVK